MEFIQWYTGSAVGKGEVPLDITRHAIFRLDAIDQTMMDKDTIKFIEQKDKEYWDEVDQWNYADELKIDKAKEKKTRNHLSYRVSTEDEEEYRKECIDIFSKLLSSYNTYDILTDFTNGAKE